MKTINKHKSLLAYYRWLTWTLERHEYGKYRTDVVATLDSNLKLSYVVYSDE